MISRPRRVVFDYLADARNLPRWRATVKRCRQTCLTAPAPGATYELTRDRATPWRSRKASQETVVLAPHRQLHWIRREGPFSADIDCSLQPLGEETMLWYAEMLHGLDVAFFGPVDLRVRRHQLTRDLWRLKALLEAPTGP